MSYNRKKLKLSFNSPVVLGFSITCLIVLILNRLSGGALNYKLFSVYRSSLLDPLTYFRFFGHILGHMNWNHFFGNMMILLVIGPILEEKYGSKNILYIILITALVTGIIHFILFPNIQLLGASGVVFAFILLASFTGIKEGEIPITFVLVAIIYLGQEVFDSLFIQDNISNLTHIVGGIVGSSIGYSLNKDNIKKY